MLSGRWTGNKGQKTRKLHATLRVRTLTFRFSQFEPSVVRDASAGPSDDVNQYLVRGQQHQDTYVDMVGNSNNYVKLERLAPCIHNAFLQKASFWSGGTSGVAYLAFRTSGGGGGYRNNRGKSQRAHVGMLKLRRRLPNPSSGFHRFAFNNTRLTWSWVDDVMGVYVSQVVGFHNSENVETIQLVPH